MAVLGTAEAATVTIGSPLTAKFNLGTECPSTCTLANTVLAEPGSMTVAPSDGVLIRWRMVGGTPAYKYQLRLLRPQGAGKYAGAGKSGGAFPASSGIETFAAGLQIRAGDLIGIDLEPSAGIGLVSGTGATLSRWVPALAEGALGAPNEVSGTEEVGFNADLQLPPAISAIAPSSGSVAGGTSVAISGHDFGGASAVRFGGVPATSFTVDSEAQITAVSPPTSGPGMVNVSVTTAAGSAASQFTYTAAVSPASCAVPRLKGRKLSAARRTLIKAGCRLGRVKHKKGQRARRGKKARVVGQSAKPGKVLPEGRKINIRLG